MAASAQGDTVTSRPAVLIAMFGAAALLAVPGSKPAPLLVCNTSESAPIGLYACSLMASSRSRLSSPCPEPLATVLAEGGYLPSGVPLIKRILAMPGQSVCRNELLQCRQNRDRHGPRACPRRPGAARLARLPRHRGGRGLSMNWTEPASLDGCYFGPIPSSAIIGRAKPVWTFEEE
jgi:type IV secretory pathway protease TraF